MRNVPSLPPPITIPEEAPGVKPLSSGRAARRVTEPSGPPRVVSHYGPGPVHERTEKEPPTEEHRSSSGDRRKMCRRIDKKPPPLMDTRADGDRRHRNRRKEDIKTNVEEEA